MARTITCEDCGAQRLNARYKNTRYCKSCRLLRDLVFLDETQRPCSHCKSTFAPTSTKDTLCGTCNYGSVYSGPCAFCKEDAELHRQGIPVCVRCIRSPALRRTIISGLKRGQKERKAA
jgi:hypothetical protein